MILNKKHEKIIRKAVKNNTANLKLAFIEASVNINDNLKDKMTIDQVHNAWYNRLRHSKKVVFRTKLNNTSINNTKNSSKCLVKTVK